MKKLQLFLATIAMAATILACTTAYDPPDNYLIDCGSRSDTIDAYGRTFVSDKPGSSSSSSSWSLSAPKSITASTSSKTSPSPLHRTARIFPEPSSYRFSIQEGRHFIRLHFLPFVSGGYDLTAARFSVSTTSSSSFTLLNSFQSPNTSAVVLKEYSVILTASSLVLTFTPSPSSFAFVSAIEVVSVPGNLIGNTSVELVIGGDSLGGERFEGLPYTAMETIHRVNMGGSEVSPLNDTLSRTWVPDRKFLFSQNLAEATAFSGKVNYPEGGATEETAPRAVYGTATEMSLANVSVGNFNVTWDFPADSGYTYFVRMHFCDIVSKSLNELLFNVYIGSSIAVRDLDLSTLTTGTLATAYYMDFVVEIVDESGKIRISIGPSTSPKVDPNAILNGLEIMKMNNSIGSLDGIGSVGGGGGGGSGSRMGRNLGIALGVVIGAVIISAIFLCMARRRKGKLQRKKSSTTMLSWLPISISNTFGSRCSNGTLASTAGTNMDLGLSFPFAALQEATNNFDEREVIGVGGFGNVYKGVLRDETKVAVKRGNPRSQQGINEFQTEIELLSRLRHRHLVSLIGYCDEGNEMILIYEYMEEGTLKSHLYGSNKPSLSWKQRLEICIGAARGLHYLHTGQAKAIIHRDVKSANILLDENLHAKVADFGLSKAGPELDQTHVSTAVKGSFGYLDPEYFRRQQLTDKSDVYSFGVVLLEVLCGRPVIDPTLPREMVNLAEWALKNLKRGQLENIVDQRLAATIRPESLRKYGETAEKCLADYGADRPSMGDVLWNLEYVLQLQEALDSTGKDGDGGDGGRSMQLVPQIRNDIGNLGTEMVVASGSSNPNDDNSDMSMNQVFSQLMESKGR